VVAKTVVEVPGTAGTAARAAVTSPLAVASDRSGENAAIPACAEGELAALEPTWAQPSPAPAPTATTDTAIAVARQCPWIHLLGWLALLVWMFWDVFMVALPGSSMRVLKWTSSLCNP